MSNPVALYNASTASSLASFAPATVHQAEELAVKAGSASLHLAEKVANSSSLKRSALFGLATMATKIPGSFYRRFVDDANAPEVIKSIDNKRELCLQSLCFGIGFMMDALVNPRIASTFPNFFKNPMSKALLMVPCLFLAEGAARVIAGQKKDLYKNVYATNSVAPDFSGKVPGHPSVQRFAASDGLHPNPNPFQVRVQPGSTFKAFAA